MTSLLSLSLYFPSNSIIKNIRQHISISQSPAQNLLSTCQQITQSTYNTNFSFIMEVKLSYVNYLQKLLNQHSINYIQEETYNLQEQQQQKKIEKSEQIAGHLQTNVQAPLNKELIERYSRQMLLKEIAYQGQVKIVQAKVALIGSGGIGCPLALYLAAAGVGTLGLFDSDRVDVTNLHRQVGHRTDRLGMQKTESLKRTLQAINPHININKHPFITVQTCHMLDDYDYVIDGSDNPMCRYIVNDYCMQKGKKLLSGACIGWQAQITCYGGNNLCYRCLWGNDQVSMGGCSSLGVVGMLPGLVGMILATEALKLIIGGESSLEGKLLTYEARKCEFKKMALRKKKSDCIGCGENKINMKEYNYSKYTLCSDGAPPKVDEIDWKTYITSHAARTILDVRPSNLYNIVHFINSKNIPLEQIKKLNKDEVLTILGIQEEEVIPVSCARGVTSKHASNYLNGLGLKAVSISGGIKGYSNDYDQSVPQL